MLAILLGIGGFVLGARTRVPDAVVAVCIGGGAGLVLFGVVSVPIVWYGVIAIALGALVFFPIYALFWTLHDFVETTVRSDQ
jgi:hypothetical protein